MYGLLVELATPIPMPSYPTLSRTQLAMGSAMTCVGSTRTGPTEGPFAIGYDIEGSVGWWGVSPEGAATIQGDFGDGCFVGNTLVAVQGKPFAIQDVSFLASWIDGVFCNGATCGSVVEGSTEISFCTCDLGATCTSGTCVLPLRPRLPQLRGLLHEVAVRVRR